MGTRTPPSWEALNIENGLIFRILGFFKRSFLHRIRIVLYKDESDPLLSIEVVILQRL